jgi:membrane-associated protease RseP (regulator of RpoE activity)
MKVPTSLRCNAALAPCLFALILAGCSTTKSKAPPKPEAQKYHQRGWIGGKYEFADYGHHFLGLPITSDPPMPHDPAFTNRTGLLITRLGTNTPAYQAGLREGDLIMALDQQPVSTWEAFYQAVDAAKPGRSLTVTAWRSGRTFDSTVCVGREVYDYSGTLTLGLHWPFDLGKLELWPYPPDFSLGFVLGFEPEDERKELNTPKGDYRRGVTGGNFTLSETDWRAWLIFLSLEKSKTIHSQEIVATTDSTPAPAR